MRLVIPSVHETVFLVSTHQLYRIGPY